MEVRYAKDSLQEGEFIAGLPKDGSSVIVPASIAQAWISAGVATPVKIVVISDDKENE
jgi:hypothetical protein